ncbi:MAG: branched-chain amino acid ABC transporter permease [Nocardioidaceae bacterium]|nr:branched-chain amino acid ABC transporter permease [Nocardioidaceae bacterium]
MPERAGRRRLLTTVLVSSLALVAIAAVPYTLSTFSVSLVTLVVAAGLLAVSVNMLAGELMLVSLGQAGIAAASAYGVGWAVGQGYPLAGQLLVALAATLVVSAVYAGMSLRTSGIYFLMATLALGMIVYGLAFRLSTVTGGENGLAGIAPPAPLRQSWQFYYWSVAVLVVVMVAWTVVQRSPFGLVLRGIRESESRMRSLGYNVAAFKFAAVMISGFVAGLAGLLTVWHSQFVSPSSAGFHRSALVVVMVILGGAGRTLGPVVGAALVVWTEQVVSTHFERWPTALGLLLVVVVLWAPGGFVGGLEAARSSLRLPAHSRTKG